ncbi:MAG: hypothetical protein AAGE65_09650 [Planctomycetota bacterium]
MTLSTPDPTPGSDRPRRWRDSLGWPAYVGSALLLATLGLKLFLRIRGSSNELGVSHALGEFTGGLIIGALLASVASAIVFYLFRRGRRAANLVFASVMVLLVLGQLGSLGREGQLVREMDQLVRQNASENVAMLEDAIANNDGVVKDGAERMGRNLDRLDQFAQAAGGAEGKLLSALAQVMREFQATIAETEAQALAFERAGGLDPTRLQTREQLEASLGRLDRWRELNGKALDQLRGIEQSLRRELAGEDVPPSLIRDAVTGLKASGELPITVRFRESDVRLLDASVQYVTVLRDELGRWSIAEDASVWFEEDAAIERFNAAVDVMDEESRLQEQLTEQLLEVARRKAQGGRP